MLEAKVQAEILRLFFSEHLPQRQIAKLLGVNRKSVTRVIDRRMVTGSREKQIRPASILAPYYGQIQQMLQQAPDRSSVNLLQQLRQAGYPGGITILREHVHTLRPPAPREAFFQLEFAKGEAAQVDWGEFGDVFRNGTKVHAFVMVLCYSRMLYLEFTQRETLPTLLRCYERALKFFGGRCREYWHDNMPTVVAERLGRLGRFTEAFWAYAGFHGFKPILCNLQAPHEKGRVEDGVKLVRYQFWPGRAFHDMQDMNQQACNWRDQFANRREHQATGKVPELMFEAERASLLPLRPEPYDTDELVSGKVSRFYRVRFDTNTYSVPWTLVGKTVTLRADDVSLRIFYGHKQVASHQRSYQKGQDLKNPAHEQGLKELKPGASRTGRMEAVCSIGPHARRYVELIQAGNRSLRTELQELLCLATVYGPAPLEETIGALLTTGIVGAGHLERALRLRQIAPKAPPPLQLQNQRLQFVPPTPNLDSYDSILLEARTEHDHQEEEP